MATTVREDAIRDFSLYSVCRGWTGRCCSGNFSVSYLTVAMQTESQRTCRSPYFLDRSALCTLRTPRLSKCVYDTLLRIELALFDIGSFVGGRNLSCQISQARGIIRSIGYFWSKHRGFGRRTVEEVPKDLCSSILRGKPMRTASGLKSDYDRQRNNKLVWDETTRIMTDLFDNVWGDRSEIVVDNFLDISLQVRYTWLILYPPFSNLSTRSHSSSSAPQVNYIPFQPLCSLTSTLEFGRRVTWTSDLIVPPGHQMTFKDALHILSTNVILKIVLPSWAKNLTKHTRKVQLAFNELKVCCSKLS